MSPLLILQLTHAGRYSLPKPIIARRHPLLDSLAAIPADHALISDDELDRLQERYLLAAGLAQESGFDGIDIKACHGYLINELLASFPRNESRYGGPLANRSRFLLQTIEKIGEEIPDLIVTSRLSMADFIAGGFGMDPDDPQKEDLTETRRVIAELKKIGVPLLNLSLGNPRVAPHLGRPFDVPLKGSAVPCENPLAGVARLIRLAGELQQAFHDLPLVRLRLFLAAPVFSERGRWRSQPGWGVARRHGPQRFRLPGRAARPAGEREARPGQGMHHLLALFLAAAPQRASRLRGPRPRCLLTRND